MRQGIRACRPCSKLSHACTYCNLCINVPDRASGRPSVVTTYWLINNIEQ
jgi:hypothetical protein